MQAYIIKILISGARVEIHFSGGYPTVILLNYGMERQKELKGLEGKEVELIIQEIEVEEIHYKGKKVFPIGTDIYLRDPLI